MEGGANATIRDADVRTAIHHCTANTSTKSVQSICRHLSEQHAYEPINMMDMTGMTALVRSDIASKMARHPPVSSVDVVHCARQTQARAHPTQVWSGRKPEQSRS
jgi:hypothetical protein